MLPALLTFGGAFLMMAWLDWSIAILVVLFLPAYFIVMKLVGRRIRPLTTDWIRSWSSLMSLVQENLGLLTAIKALTQSGR